MKKSQTLAIVAGITACTIGEIASIIRMNKLEKRLDDELEASRIRDEETRNLIRTISAKRNSAKVQTSPGPANAAMKVRFQIHAKYLHIGNVYLYGSEFIDDYEQLDHDIRAVASFIKKQYGDVSTLHVVSEATNVTYEVAYNSETYPIANVGILYPNGHKEEMKGYVQDAGEFILYRDGRERGGYNYFKKKRNCPAG